MKIVETITSSLSEFITGLGGGFVSAFQNLFMIKSPEGTFSGINDLGVFMLTMFGVALGYGVIRFIMGLFRRETR